MCVIQAYSGANINEESFKMQLGTLKGRCLASPSVAAYFTFLGRKAVTLLDSCGRTIFRLTHQQPANEKRPQLN